MGAIASAAPSLPFYYYHIPSATNVDLPMVDFLAVADDLIQNLAGIKYTHYDLEDLQLCLHYGGGKYNILFGRDQYLLAAVALGVRGAVGSTYNFMGDTMARILSAFDLRRRQRECNRDRARHAALDGLAHQGARRVGCQVARHVRTQSDGEPDRGQCRTREAAIFADERRGEGRSQGARERVVRNAAGEGSRAAMVRKADNGQPVSQQDNARSGEVTIEWWCARWVAL